MRLRFSLLAITLSGACFAQGQEQQQVFPLAHIDTPQKVQEFINIIRSIGEAQHVAAGPNARAIAVSGTAAQIALTEWFAKLLDQPAASRPASFAVYDTTFADPRSPAVKLVFPAHTSTPQQLQEMVNGVRSIAEIQRVVVFTAMRAIALRGRADALAFGEWMIREIDDASSGSATRETRAATFPDDLNIPDRRTTAVRIYYPAAVRTNIAIQEAVNAIRSIGGIQRVVAITAAHAIVARGNEPQAALADWLMRELDQARPPAGEHQFTDPGGELVRVFFASKPATSQDLMQTINSIRVTTGIQRAVAYEGNGALIFRGNPDQIARAADLIRSLL